MNILFSDKPEVYHQQFRKEAGKLLGLTAEDIESILEQVHIKVKEAGTYFNLKIKPPNRCRKFFRRQIFD